MSIDSWNVVCYTWFIHKKYNDTDKERNGKTMETVLQVKGLSKQYKKGIYASHTDNFAVGKGEIFAMIGPNGQGKPPP